MIFLGLGMAGAMLILNGTCIRYSPQNTKRDGINVHKISLVNTLIGWNWSPALKFAVVLFNVVVLSIWIGGAIIRPELQEAWGCYSGSLSLAQLTANTCTANGGIPERCWNIWPLNPPSVSCYGTRSPGGAWTQHVPPILLAAEWIFTAAIVIRRENE